jgi:hypothetical protein
MRSAFRAATETAWPEQPPTAAADPAPAFSAVELGSGHALSLTDLRGSVVLLNSWAMWCDPFGDLASERAMPAPSSSA